LWKKCFEEILWKKVEKLLSKEGFEEILWKASKEKTFVERRFWRNFVEKF
jgi:hypothetical protein